jgi:hypothetical protein
MCAKECPLIAISLKTIAAVISRHCHIGILPTIRRKERGANEGRSGHPGPSKNDQSLALLPPA